MGLVDLADQGVVVAMMAVGAVGVVVGAVVGVAVVVVVVVVGVPTMLDKIRPRCNSLRR